MNKLQRRSVHIIVKLKLTHVTITIHSLLAILEVEVSTNVHY